MAVLPRRVFEIETTLSVESVLTSFEGALISSRPLRLLGAVFPRQRNRPFVGCVGDSSFRIWPNARYANFGPAITGKVEKMDGGARIRVSVGADSGIALGYILVAGGLALGVLAGFSAPNRAVLLPSALFLLAFGAVFSVFAHVMYLGEVDATRSKLTAIVKRTEADGSLKEENVSN